MRTRTYQYPPTKPEAIHALLGYHDQALAHALDPEHSPEPDHKLLLVGLPQGALESAKLIEEPSGRVLVACTIQGRNPRMFNPLSFLALRAMAAFGHGIYIDKNSVGPERLDYLLVGHNNGITFMRLAANAEAAQAATLAGDHHDLTATNIVLVAGSKRNVRGRREARAEALKSYDKNAASWGLAKLLSREDYAALMDGAFRLFDAKHGVSFMRPLVKPSA